MGYECAETRELVGRTEHNRTPGTPVTSAQNAITCQCTLSSLEILVGRRIMRILSINVHFVVQRPGAHHFKATIFNLDRVKTSSDTLGRHARPCLANTAGIGINSSKDTVRV